MNRTATALLLLLLLAAAAGWESVAPLPGPRYSGCAVALADKVYYLGGSVIGGAKTRTMFIYDPVRDSWSVGDSMLTARHRFGAAALEGRIYAYGGWGDGGVLLNSAEVYDTATSGWSAIETLPLARASLTGAAAGGRVYAVGGRTNDSTLGRVDAYDPGTGHWTEMNPMPTPRCEAASSEDAGFICVVGGTDHLGAAIMDAVEFYDALYDTWYAHPPSPYPCASAGAHFDGRDFYMFGGWSPGPIPTAGHYQYDARHRVWRQHDSLGAPRTYLAGAAVEPWLFAIGGQIDHQPTDAVERTERPLAVSGQDLPTGPDHLEVRPAIGAGPFSIRLPGTSTRTGPLTVFDATGREVACLEITRDPAGSSAIWPARDVPTGVYYCSVRSGPKPALVKLVIR